MSLTHFTVTQLRVAATCPRIHFFDAAQSRKEGRLRVTRIWRAGSGHAAGGALFHHVVERFNREASRAPEVSEALHASATAEQIQEALLRYVNAHCIDLEALAQRPLDLRQGFVTTLHQYFAELGYVALSGRRAGNSVDAIVQQLFGDTRRRVDVTFRVGAERQDEVHVTGAIDYVFFDWRTQSHRIIDYKLTPASDPNSDLFQVCAYSLMHHHQHGTRPGAAVFYLHPERKVAEKTWEQVHGERHKVYDLLASMVGWSRYDPRTRAGLKPPGMPSMCGQCKWNRECEARLGPKTEGAFDHHWEELAARHADARPDVKARTPAEAPPDNEAEDDEDAEEAVREPFFTEIAGVAGDGGGLFLGQIGKGPGPVLLPPERLRTHVAVVGGAGSGKTWMAKVIAEEAIRSSVPVIAVDPQGDLVQFLSRRARGEVPGDLGGAYDGFWSKVDVRIFTPGSSHGVRLSLDPIRVPAPADLERLPPSKREEELDGILSAIAGNLVSLAGGGAETASQAAYVYTVLKGLAPRPSMSLADIVAALSDPSLSGIDEPDLLVKKGDRERLVRRLYALVQGPGARLFTGGTRLDLDRLLRPSTPGRVPLNVLYLNALTDDAQKQFFVASLASEIYRYMVTSLDATDGRPNLLFYLDEARDFVPAGARKPPAKDPLLRLFMQGRKYGVACLLCTQSPRSVDYNVFGNCATKLVGRLQAAQDVARVEEWFELSGAPPAWIAGRKDAAPGSFVASWPEMPEAVEGQPFRGRMLFSEHKGAWSPDRVEREVDKSGLRGEFEG